MPTIGRIGSAIVMVFRNDHPPPHFHVFDDRFSAKFSIEDGTVLSVTGTMPPRLARAIRAWGHRHRAALYENWELAQAGERARKIEGYLMLYSIVAADAHADHTVSITWSDGVCGVVDLTPYIARGGLFAALDDPEYFARELRILPNGIGLTWPHEVDFSADGLRKDARFAKVSPSHLAKAG